MKNLSGDENCDKTIKKELELANVFLDNDKGKGEVPYNLIGRMGPWIFKRSWNYWEVFVPEGEKGLPLDIAMEMHYTKNPMKPDSILGKSIRSGGHCGCPSPDEYGAQPIYDEELEEQLRKLGCKEVYSSVLGKTYIPISVGEISKLNREGKLNVLFYVNSYHVDDQIGLNSLVHTIIKHLKKEIWG